VIEVGSDRVKIAHGFDPAIEASRGFADEHGFSLAPSLEAHMQ
jgi:hypothetical protein